MSLQGCYINRTLMCIFYYSLHSVYLFIHAYKLIISEKTLMVFPAIVKNFYSGLFLIASYFSIKIDKGLIIVTGNIVVIFR